MSSFPPGPRRRLEQSLSEEPLSPHPVPEIQAQRSRQRLDWRPCYGPILSQVHTDPAWPGWLGGTGLDWPERRGFPNPRPCLGFLPDLKFLNESPECSETPRPPSAFSMTGDGFIPHPTQMGTKICLQTAHPDAYLSGDRRCWDAQRWSAFNFSRNFSTYSGSSLWSLRPVSWSQHVYGAPAVSCHLGVRIQHRPVLRKLTFVCVSVELCMSLTVTVVTIYWGLVCAKYCAKHLTWPINTSGMMASFSGAFGWRVRPGWYHGPSCCPALSCPPTTARYREADTCHTARAYRPESGAWIVF